MKEFHVGQRVRMTAHGHNQFQYRKSFTGTVKSVTIRTWGGTTYAYVRVHGDGYSRTEGPYHEDFWEPVPYTALAADDAAVALARATLRGDVEAARALVDRVQEILDELPSQETRR